MLGTIIDDIMAAFNQFYNLVGSNFGALNTAVVALLPKKEGAMTINDYKAHLQSTFPQAC